MNIFTRYLIILLAFVITSGAAYAYWSYSRANSSLSDTAQVRMTVVGLGDNLQKIPLLADKTLVGQGMDRFYGQYVHPDLLAKWKADPSIAPGRLISSPWPDRIDITKVTKNADGTYTVDAGIVEVANGNGGPETTGTDPVRFTLTEGPDGWQITDYQKL